MPKTIPVNVGGQPSTGGKGGVLGEAELTFTKGGLFIDITVGETNAVRVPTLGFDRDQLSAELIGANMYDLFEEQPES